MNNLKKLKRNENEAKTKAMALAKMMNENRDEVTFQNLLIHDDNMKKYGEARCAVKKYIVQLRCRLKHRRKTNT